MSGFIKTTNNNQALGTSGGALAVSSDITFNGKVYCTNVSNCFNLQYGDTTSLQSLVSNIITAYSNTAIGMNTLPVLTSGFANTSVGSYALRSSISGIQNTALGSAALYTNTTGQYNVAVGNDCLMQNTTGSNNTGVGKGCMFGGGGGIITFNNCVGVGYQSLGNLTTSNYNVGIGTQAGASLVTGSRNTCIGCTANTSKEFCVQSTALGFGAFATASNQIMLGTVSESVVCPNSLTVTGSMQSNSIYYENTQIIGGAVNAYTLSYSTGGIFYIPSSIAITANSTLIITNIPTSTTQSFTFTVGYYQFSTRNYINLLRVSDTTGTTYLLGTSSTFDIPLFNGGLPALSGTKPCLILQQFTVFSIETSRYVGTSISSFQ